MRIVLALVPLVLATAGSAAALVADCPTVGSATVCVFAGFEPHMSGAMIDAYAGEATVGAGAIYGQGFLGPFAIVDVHGGLGEYGWHAGAGESDYDFDRIPDSTCVCAGVWSYQTGYLAIVSIGTFERTGDGPSVDDTFVVVGAAGAGVVYDWWSGEPGVSVILP